MNPLTNIRNLTKLTENEIKLGTVGTSKSWHNQYRDSAWIFFGGMPFELTEGDIISIFEQYGSVVNINLIRDKKTGKSKGFGFICYENQLSTDLAVDNFNGIQVIGRTIKVDHAANYKPPKDHDDADEVTKFLREEGCSAKVIKEKKESLPATAFVKPSENKKENRLDDFKDEKDIKKEKTKNQDEHKSKKNRYHSRSASSRSSSSSSLSSRSRSVQRRKDDKYYRDRHYKNKEREKKRDSDRDRSRERRDRNRDRERSNRDRDYKKRY